jgi:hypothetical protein
MEENKIKKENEMNSNEKGKRNKYLLITLGGILICIFLLRYSQINCSNKSNILKGGVSQATSNILFTFTNSFRRLAGNCMNCTFTNSIDSIKNIFETILSILAIVIAIILIPSFPIVIYIILIYIVITNLFTGMRNI